MKKTFKQIQKELEELKYKQRDINIQKYIKREINLSTRKTKNKKKYNRNDYKRGVYDLKTFRCL